MAACSAPAPDSVDTAADDAPAARELALQSSDATPVASELEVHRPDAQAPEPSSPMHPPRDATDPLPEPLGRAVTGDAAGMQMTPAPAPAHVHAADAGDAVAGPAEPGGGKPRGVSTGLGPVTDGNWGDPAIMDDPNPIPGRIGGEGTVLTGRDGVIIIRGGMGGIDDDCAIHPRGGMRPGGGMPTGQPGGVLINDRSPRRGASINERAPRSPNRPSLPGGGGLTRRGIR
jgi:hypothetical protein